MNTKTLGVFLEVVRSGSLSAAARILGMSQPAVTKQIQALEEELGAELLLRGHSGVRGLTAAGQTLSDYALRALAEYEALQRQLQAISTQIEGILDLAASTTPGHFILPDLILAFRNNYPHIQVHLHISNTADVVERVRDGRSSLGFVGNIVPDQHIICQPFRHDEIMLVVPAQHPFALRSEVDISELYREKLVLREPGSGTRVTIESRLSSAERTALHQAALLELGSTHAVLSTVTEGKGIGFVSLRALHHVRPENVVMVRIHGKEFRRDLYMIHRRDTSEQHLLRLFSSFATADSDEAKA